MFFPVIDLGVQHVFGAIFCFFVGMKVGRTHFEKHNQEYNATYLFMFYICFIQIGFRLFEYISRNLRAAARFLKVNLTLNKRVAERNSNTLQCSLGLLTIKCFITCLASFITTLYKSSLIVS